MQPNNQEQTALLKSLLMWIGTVVGSLTLSKVVLFATLVYTLLNTYVLVRDKVFRKDTENARDQP